MTSSIVSFYQGLSLVQVSNSYPTWKLQFQEVSALPWSHGRKCFRGPELKLPERFSFIKRPEACNFIKKETLAQVFSCEFCKISKNTFFTEHLRWLLLHSYTTQSCLSQNAIYGNAFKARSQTFVNKHNWTCEMCFNLFLLSFSMEKSDHEVKLNW